MADFPNSIDGNDTLPNPNATDLTNSSPVPHHLLHGNTNDAIKAIETKLGAGSTTPGVTGQILQSVNGASVWQPYTVGGDLTGTLPNPVLVSSGVSAGTYGSDTEVPVITIDGKGRVTSASNVLITGGGGGGGPSVLTTKGDMLGYDTAPDRLPIGTNGQILTVDSTQPMGIKWGPAPNSAVWGGITGTLSNQTDLQTALNAKVAGPASSVAGNIPTFSDTSGKVVQDGGKALPAGAIVGTTDTQTLTNKTLTSPVISTIVNTGTLTLPTATGTIALTSSNITGTAANVTGTVAVANGGTGATTLSSNGVLVGNGTAAVTTTKAAPTGAFVGDSDTQTLSNKTFTSPVINTGTVGADPTVNLGVASKQYVDNLGTGTLVQNETPGGLINGTNTAYTTASTFATGSLRVYLNGQRLVSGSSNDYVEVTQGFTMEYAPATGDVLLVDYNVNNTKFIQGSNSIIVQETPTGTVNGTTTLFTVLQGKYVANTLEVYLNGVQQTKTSDYTETSPGSGTFTFTNAPVTGDVVKVGYQFSTGSSGNADTVDGYHGNDLMPIGVLLPYAGSTAPSYWLLCFGQAISRTTYAALFAAIGTTYGTGDGSTTFNLPDARGRVIAGADAMGGTAANRLGSGSAGGITGTASPGATGGEQAHVQSVAEMAAHTHNAGNLNGNRFSFSNVSGIYPQLASDAYGNNAPTSSTGSSNAANVVQPTIVTNYIIKAL